MTGVGQSDPVGGGGGDESGAPLSGVSIVDDPLDELPDAVSDDALEDPVAEDAVLDELSAEDETDPEEVSAALEPADDALPVPSLEPAEIDPAEELAGPFEDDPPPGAPPLWLDEPHPVDPPPANTAIATEAKRPNVRTLPIAILLGARPYGGGFGPGRPGRTVTGPPRPGRGRCCNSSRIIHCGGNWERGRGACSDADRRQVSGPLREAVAAARMAS